MRYSDKHRYAYLIITVLLAIGLFPSNLQGQEDDESLVGESIVLLFTDNTLTGKIVGKITDAASEFYGMYQFMADNFEYYQDEDLLNYRMASADGYDIASSILNPPELGFLLIREHFRFMKIAWNDMQNFFIIDNQSPALSKTENFYATFDHEGVTYTISLRVRLNQYGVPGSDYFVIIDQAKIVPGELPSRFGTAGGIEVDLAVLFDGYECFSNKVWLKNYGGLTLTPFTESNFRLAMAITPSQWDQVFNKTLGIRVILTDRDRSALFAKKPHVIHNLTLTGGNPPEPPDTPTITVQSNQSTLSIQLSCESDIDGFTLYKSTVPDFSIEEAAQITVSGNSFTDTEVVGGTTYYYRAIARKGNLISNPSIVRSGRPLTLYKMLINSSFTEIEENQFFTIEGNITDLEGTPLRNTEIIVTSPSGGCSFESITTDSEGNFRFKGRASTIPGLQSYLFTVGDETSGIQVEKKFTVVAGEERGRDISITDVITNRTIVPPGQPVSPMVTVSNNGQFTAGSVNLKYNIRNQAGALVFSQSEVRYSLAPNTSWLIQPVINLPPEIPTGNYTLEVTANNELEEDELEGDNKYVKGLFIEQEFNRPVYRTQNFLFNETTLCRNIDGYNVCVEQINRTDTTVVIGVNTENSGKLNISSSETSVWFNTVQDFIVMPAFLTFTDTTFTLTLRAGRTNTLNQLSPGFSVIKPGYDGDLNVSAPSGSELDLNSFSFRFGTDYNIMKNWLLAANYSGNENSAILSVRMPSSATLNRYHTSFLSWENQQYRFYKEIRIKCIPLRDIYLDNIVIHNGFSEFLSGDSIMIDGTLNNNGNYREFQTLELSITKGDSILFSDFREIELSEGEVVPFRFTWSTVGQKTGIYDVRIRSLNQEDIDPDNNIYTGQIQIVETPGLVIELVDPGTVFEVNESVSIRAIVRKEDNSVVNDAQVFLEILEPDSVVIGRGLVFNPGSSDYMSTPVRLNSGGNYILSMEANHPRYNSANTSGMIQTFVDLNINIPYSKTGFLFPVPVNIDVTNVGDLAGLAGDLVFSSSQLKTIDFNASDFLSEGSTIPVSTNHYQNGNRLIFGSTRLTTARWGRVAREKTNIFNIVVLPEEDGEINVSEENFGLITSSGASMAARINFRNSQFDVIVPDVALGIDHDKLDGTVNDIDTAGVFLKNGYAIRSVNGDITFDPQAIKIVDVWEGSVLNEEGTYSTLFIKNIDNQKGRLTFGLTRTGTEDEGVNPLVGRILNFSFKPLQADTTEIRFENTSVLSAVDNILIPHTASKDSIVFKNYDVGGTHLFISPPRLFVTPDSIFEIKIFVDSVENVASFVGDIFYDPQHLAVARLSEGTFLNQNGTQSTSFMNSIDSQTGSIHVGISRLGAIPGVSTMDSADVLSIEFRTLSEASSLITIGNSYLIMPDGVSYVPHTTSDAEVINNAAQVPAHFSTVWWPGEGMDLMYLYALTATLDGEPLQPGDEIGIFEGDYCVGVGVIVQALTGNNFLVCTASRDNPGTPLKDGYTPGNAITFKVWDSSSGTELNNLTIEYVFGEGFFAEGATVRFNLSAVTAEEQMINLGTGWNMLSFAVSPVDITMHSIVEPLITSGILEKIQDEQGHAIEWLNDPVGWIDEIGQMNVTEGYKIRVSENVSLSVTGQQVPLPIDISLESGWNMVGYPSRTAQAAASVFGPLISSGALLKVQDEAGAAIEQVGGEWIYGFSTVEPGEGYKVKTSTNTVLAITTGTKGAWVHEKVEQTKPVHFIPAYTGNGLDHMNIYIEMPEGETVLSESDEIGVFDGELCVGSAIVNEEADKYISLTISYDDPETFMKDGFIEGNEILLRFWDNETGEEILFEKVEVVKGHGMAFERMGTLVLNADLLWEGEACLGNAYPNPSVEKTIFTFSLPDESDVHFEIYDIKGEKIKILVNKILPAGNYEIEWDNKTESGNRVKDGTYFYNLKLDYFSKTKLLVIH